MNRVKVGIKTGGIEKGREEAKDERQNEENDEKKETGIIDLFWWVITINVPFIVFPSVFP